MFQDGIVAQAVDEVKAAGVAYFSSAGNDGRLSYENPFRPSGITGNFGEAHDFDPGPNVDIFQRITVSEGRGFTLILQWDSPFASVSGGAGSSNDLDIYITDDPPTELLAGSNINNIGGDPLEGFNFFNSPDSGRTTFNILITKFGDGPTPSRLKYILFGFSGNIDEHDTASPTLFGHPNAVGAAAVGAAGYQHTPAFGVDPPVLRSYSSAGGIPILFTPDGTPTMELREKPEIVAPDGTNTTFFGADLEGDGFPNFFGTSAAAPHAAAVAALMRQANPALSPNDIYTALKSTAIDMNPPGFDFDSGYGLVNALAAIEAAIAVTDQSTIGLYDPIAGKFFLRNANSPGAADMTFRFGPANTGWLLLSGDWNNDGTDTVGLYDPIAGKFFLRNANSAGSANTAFRFGPANPGWLPLTGDWNNSGRDTVGLYDPIAGKFFLRNANSAGSANTAFRFGPANPGWLPLSGDW